jgi:hypothetical protein
MYGSAADAIPTTPYPADTELKASNFLNNSVSTITEYDKWYLADQYARVLMDREMVSAP